MLHDQVDGHCEQKEGETPGEEVALGAWKTRGKLEAMTLLPLPPIPRWGAVTLHWGAVTLRGGAASLPLPSLPPGQRGQAGSSQGETDRPCTPGLGEAPFPERGMSWELFARRHCTQTGSQAR